MSDLKEDKGNRKKEPSVGDLKDSLEAEHNDMVSFRQKSERLQTQLDAMRGIVEEQAKKITDLEITNTKNSSKVYKLRILDYETRTNSYMRMVVVVVFAFVGPILLGVYLSNLSSSSILLDIFKFWLGAAIGISTNVLQRTSKAEGTIYPETEEKESAPKKEEEKKI